MKSILILPDRFWSKVDMNPHHCWEWQASLDRHGYGQFNIGRWHGKVRMRRAHRVAFELANGPISDGMVLDHLCKNPKCVNPDHLEAVTQGENVRRGSAGKHAGNRKPFCRQGHDMATAYTRPDGRRLCRTCVSIRESATSKAS